MAKYVELEASVCVSARGEIVGDSPLNRNSVAVENTAKGGECRESSDTEKKEVTA